MHLYLWSLHLSSQSEQLYNYDVIESMFLSMSIFRRWNIWGINQYPRYHSNIILPFQMSDHEETRGCQGAIFCIQSSTTYLKKFKGQRLCMDQVWSGTHRLEANLEKKDPWFHINQTSIGHFRVRAISNKCWSEDFCFLVPPLRTWFNWD